MRVLSVFIAILPAFAQLPPGVPPDLRFGVASLKAAPNPGVNELIHPLPGGRQYNAADTSVRTMLQVAFRARPEQVTGIPGWLDSQRFDMEARAEKPSSADELHVMLLNLLADRMHLRYHVEKKDMPRYVLTVAKGGTKLSPRESAAGDSEIVPEGHDLQLSMHGVNASMNFLAFRPGNEELDRRVADMTGLKGTYDFELDYTRDPPNRDPGPRSASLFPAIRQQLGLELKADKGPVDVIVVDHAERLNEN